MRILRVAQHLYPAVRGGAPYHVHAMSRDQAAMGHDVTVLTTHHDRSLPATETTDGYTVVRVPPGVAVAGNHVSPAVARYLWREAGDFDVVHAHSHLYFATNMAAVVRRVGGPPLAITNHGFYSQSAPERVFRWYLRTLGRWTFNRADAVCCYTDVDRDRLRESGVSSRIEVIPNGIDTDRFTPTGPTSDRIDHDGPVLLFVGRLVEGKRPALVLEAYEQLAADRSDLGLVVCGDGPLRRELEARAPQGVQFPGSVPYADMPAIYRSADVLALPSRAEGTPRVIMEALASGVGVVCSDLAHLRSAFGDAVRYVDPDQPAGALAEAIGVELAADRAAGLDDSFRWERTVAETTEVLASLVTAPSAGESISP